MDINVAAGVTPYKGLLDVSSATGVTGVELVSSLSQRVIQESLTMPAGAP